MKAGNQTELIKVEIGGSCKTCGQEGIILIAPEKIPRACEQCPVAIKAQSRKKKG